MLVENQARRTSRVLWIGLGLSLGVLVLAWLLAMLNSRANRAGPLPVYGQVADFVLTNQAGAAVSLLDLRGHVWVADIIFTRCAGPCLKMSRQMKAFQDALPASSQAKIVSLTTDPDFDTPPVLAQYAHRFAADTNR